MRTIHTDGACLGNPGPGGWAWVCIAESLSDSGSSAETTTNQRMELSAVLEAVQSNPGPLLIVSDSSYVVNCFLQHWYVGWKKRNWIKSNRKPVMNRDLWEPLIDLVLSRQDVQFEWIKGHAGDVGNEAADVLATAAASRAKLVQ